MNRSLHNNINLIIDSIDKQAKEEQELLEEQFEKLYNEKATALEREIKNKYQMQTSFAVTKIKKETNRTLSNLESGYKSEISKLRQSVFESIFEKAKEELQSFVQSEGYEKFLESSAQNIALLYSGTLVVYIRTQDEKFKPNIEKAFGRAVLFEYDDSIKLGGIKVYFESASVMADDTLDARLKQQEKSFIKNSGLGNNK